MNEAVCRRCGASIRGVEESQAVSHWYDVTPAASTKPATICRTCPRCRWKNLRGFGPIYELDFRMVGALCPIPHFDLSDTRDLPEITGRVRVARSSVSSALRNLILSNVSWA